MSSELSSLANQAAQSVLPDDLVEMGYITGAYGIKGWIKIKPYSAHASDASALLNAKIWWLKPVVSSLSATGSPAVISDKAGAALSDYERIAVRTQGSELVASLMGISSREQAESLRGCAVSVSRKYFPALDDNEFYWVDLVGMTVANLEGENFGVVIGLLDNGAHPVLRINHPAQKEEMLVPFVAHFVPTVDQAARHIIVDWQADY